MPKFRWKICLFLVYVVLSPVVSVYASDYVIEPMNRLCSKADDPEAYTTSLLKSLRFLVEGEDGWIYRSTTDFLTDFREDASYVDLKAFIDQLASRGTHLVLVYVPTRGLMFHKGIPDSEFNFEAALASYKKKLNRFRELGIIVPDLSPLINAPDAEDYFFKQDIHWTPKGARKTAEIVAKAVRETGLINEQETFKVENTQAGLVTINGSLAAGTKQLCGDQFASEYVSGYTTSSYFENGGDSLFGDEPETEVVLLGSSFSALPKFNFNGFLQEYIKAPIENYAMSAGGEKGSWLKYVSQGSFHESPPKLIIWELSSYYPLDETDLFAQLKPMIENEFTEDNLLLSKKVKLDTSKKPHNTLFFSDKMTNVRSSEIALDMQLSDPGIDIIRFRVWYKNGKSVEEGVKMPSRAKMGGHFIFSMFGKMKKYNDSNLVALELTKIGDKPVQEYLAMTDKSDLEVDVKVYKINK